MAVNALVTGLIVFKILKVFLEFKPTSVERTMSSTGGSSKLRHILFIIIESGMALFVIQLIRIVHVLSILVAQTTTTAFTGVLFGMDVAICIYEMLNVTI
jgi:hypothetical protein